jgi:uncharacterized membrane protein
MKTLYRALAVVWMAILPIACNESPKGGIVDNKSTTGGTDTFSIKASSKDVAIKQGESQTVKFSLNRGTTFKQNVKLEAKVPKGISVDLTSPTVSASDPSDFSIVVAVDKDAPLGESTIKLTGTPDKGAATSVDFKVKVEENKK